MSAKPVILQVGPLPEWDETPLAESFEVKRYFDADDGAAYLAEIGEEVRGIATRGELGASAAMIDACPNAEIISVYGVGFDAVDLASCKRRGIRVTNTPDVLTKDNVSRAANIDEEALITALSSGALGYAALDVFEGEPNLDPRFLELPNVMLQPHQASGTVETRKDMGQLLRDNLTAHFDGRELLTPVN